MNEDNAPSGHVFISYVHENSREVDNLHWILESAGVRVWRDTAELWPGEDWRKKIRNAITSDALVFIACFSTEGMAREFTYQNEELNLAIEQLRLRRPNEPWLIPVRLDDCEIPDFDIGAGRTLSSLQRADLFGKNSDQATARLVTSVLRILKRHSADPDSVTTGLRSISNWSVISSRRPAPKAHATLPTQHAHGGRNVTFYSYRGGTGSSMALANIAWILAANGLRVLISDCDFEAPALHRFVRPFLGPRAEEGAGVVDLIRSYQRAAARPSERGKEELIPEYACVEQYTFPLNWDFPGGGGLDFLPVGHQNRDYAPSLAALDWDNFYERLNGGEFIDAVRADMKHHYDYALIDSPTGLSDIVDILTVQLPDVLVDCFTLNIRSIEGAAKVARSIEQRYNDRGIRILPVPMRVENAERQFVDEGLRLARSLFAGLPEMSDEQRRDYWLSVEVPYQSFYSYQDRLAVFAELPGSSTSLLASYERIAAQITGGAVTGLPPIDEELRNRTERLFIG